MVKCFFSLETRKKINFDFPNEMFVICNQHIQPTSLKTFAFALKLNIEPKFCYKLRTTVPRYRLNVLLDNYVNVIVGKEIKSTINILCLKDLSLLNTSRQKTSRRKT